MINAQKKILLIEPPFYRLFKDTYSLDKYPIGLGSLAATIKERTDWDVMVHNADFVKESEGMRVSYLAGEGFENYRSRLQDISHPIWNDIVQIVRDYQPSVIGFSTKTQNFTSVCISAEQIKKMCPEVTILVGGPHPTMVGCDVLCCDDIDIAILGEGENTLIDLLYAFEKDRGLSEVTGIAYRSEGNVCQTTPRELECNLDSFPYPFQCAEEVLHNYWDYRRSYFQYVFATRGCPYSCFFCGSKKIWGNSVRYRSPKHIALEIAHLTEKGNRHVHFDDDTFGVNKQYITAVCEEIKRIRPSVTWSCEIHVNLVDDAIVETMRNAGCNRILLGVESGNNNMLQLIRKNITIERAMAAAKTIKRYGMNVVCFFMVGFPWETEETLRDTMYAIENIESDTNVYSIFTPYPGTEAFEYCKENGLVDDNHNISLYNHQSPENNFSMHLTRDVFRKYARKIEVIIDQKNHLLVKGKL